MPRSADIYSVPPGTEGIPGQPVASTPYNAYIHDVETDLNAARPIIAGGTGATSAAAARTNLQAERATQVVTNYDTHVFEAGSFRSDPGATGEPVAMQYTSGICHMINGGAMVLEAYVYMGASLGVRYLRYKWSTWYPWVAMPSSAADLDARYVNVAGDTMTGDLTINKTYPKLTLADNGTTASTAVDIYGRRGGIADANIRWLMRLGAGAETGGNVGSDFMLLSATDAGALTQTVLNFKRSTGLGKVLGDPTEALGIATKQSSEAAATAAAAGKVNRTGDTMTGALGIACPSASLVINDTGSGGAATIYTKVRGTTQWQINCGGDYDNGSLQFIRYNPAGTVADVAFHLDRFTAKATFSGAASFVGAVTGYLGTQLGGTGASGFISDGTSVALRGWAYNPLYFQAAGGAQIYGLWGPAGFDTYTGTISRAGVGGASGGYPYAFNWTGAAFQAWVQTSNLGTITFTSDYRIKKDVLDLPSMWDTVKALRPIKYALNDWTPPWEVEAQQKRAAERGAEVEPFMARDDRERWGFIAHELQETLVETAATGVKDAENIVQSPDPWPVIAALTKVVQELMARVEALEAAP